MNKRLLFSFLTLFLTACLVMSGATIALVIYIGLAG
jgi:hypothetical protein